MSERDNKDCVGRLKRLTREEVSVRIIRREEGELALTGAQIIEILRYADLVAPPVDAEEVSVVFPMGELHGVEEGTYANVDADTPVLIRWVANLKEDESYE